MGTEEPIRRSAGGQIPLACSLGSCRPMISILRIDMCRRLRSGEFGKDAGDRWLDLQANE